MKSNGTLARESPLGVSMVARRSYKRKIQWRRRASLHLMRPTFLITLIVGEEEVIQLGN